jgi:opacity protein-like surface antigen
MKRKCVQLAFCLLAVAAACCVAAAAAPNSPARKAAADSGMAETDAGVSFYRTFTGSTSGHGTLQTPSNDYGGMIELRHIQSPLVGYEVAYSFNKANQGLAPDPGACGYVCSYTPETVNADADQVGLDWIASMKRGDISPFAVGGLGFFIAVPTQNEPNYNTVVRLMYTYGAGIDVGILPHAGLRVQYRDDLYKAPDVDENYGATDAFTQTGEATVGVYFHL